MEAYIIIDLGKSLIKCLYFRPGESVQYLTMEPELASLSESEVKSLFPSNTALPEDDAWIQLDGSASALGWLAGTRFGNRAETKREMLKHVTGVERVLGVIGAVAQREGLGTSLGNFRGESYVKVTELTLKVVVLLPWGESTNKETFTQSLHAASEDWNFRGSFFVLKSSSEIVILPEGAGMLLLRQSQLGLAKYRKSAFFTLIMGHYNVTGIITIRGTRLRAESPPLGFHSMIADTLANTSLEEYGVMGTRLTEAISSVTNGNDVPLRTLVRVMVGEKESHLEEQCAQIRRVVADVRSLYWERVEHWLAGFLGAERLLVEEVLIGGGTSALFKQELSHCFENYSLHWAHQSMKSLKGVKFKDRFLGERFVDVWGVYQWLRQGV